MHIILFTQIHGCVDGKTRKWMWLEVRYTPFTASNSLIFADMFLWKTQ